MKTEQLETLVGAKRGDMNVVSTGGVQKQAARDWLHAQGVAAAVTSGMTMAQINDVLNDTTDAKLKDAKRAISAKGGCYTFAAAPAAAPAASLGMMDQVIASIVDQRLADNAPGVDAGEVRSIVNDVLNNAQVDVNPASVEGVIDARLQTVGQDWQGRLTAALAPVKPLLEAMAADASVNSSRRTPVLTAMAKGSRIMRDLAPFYKPGVDVGFNCMVCSPPSFGKSFTIRQLGETYDLFLEHGCSDDMDEISTLLGNPTPDGNGGFITFDGVLAQAMRAAADGKHVLFLMDEVLRLPPTVQSWLLTDLAPKMVNGQRTYSLRTRRVDNGALEVLTAPATHLHIVAATNLTMAMPVGAFWSRWEKIRVEWSQEQARDTAQQILSAHGIPERKTKPALADHFAAIMGQSRRSVKEGSTAFPVDFRMLERAAMSAPKACEQAVGDRLADRLADNVANWDGDLGDACPESLKVAKGWAATLRVVARSA